MGGGFGGSSIHLLDKNCLDRFIKYINNFYYEKYNIIPDFIHVKFQGGIKYL